MEAAFIASPSDRDHQQSDSEVAIILSLRNSAPESPAEAERRLVLTREAPSIRVGRASKVPTKGFVAAKENAWFDSPVMSRQHAELIANFDSNPKSVSVQDVGSLHGTFHTPNNGISKETRLEPNQPVTLANGDILRFGIDIFRSKETFPPCAVDFLMEEKPISAKTPTKGTFSVPDDIDEDEVDYMSEISESDMVFEVQPDSKMLIPQASSRETPRHTLSIDLTGEDTHPSATRDKSDFIDLTSEPEQDSESELDVAIQDPPIQQTTGALTCQQTFQVGDDKLDMKQSDRGFDTDYASDRETGFRVGCDEDSDEDYFLRLSSSDHESQASEDSEMSDESVTSEVGDECSAADASEDEGIRKSPYYEDSESSSSDDVHDTAIGQPSSSAFAPAASAVSATSCIPQARDPSPSDAAMFKSRPLLSQPSSISRAQALGEKTGKFAYFAARENNRATVNYHDTAVPVSAIRETLQSEPESSSVPPEVAVAKTTSDTHDGIAPVNFKASSTTQDSAWSTSGERFINNPRTDELPSLPADKAQTPDLDMTSAYTFQQSKLATEAETRQSIRRLPIQDLLAQEPRESSTELAQPSQPQLPRLSEMERPTGAKRSFDDAFDGDEQSADYDHGESNHQGTHASGEYLTTGDAPEPSRSHPTSDDVPMQELTGPIMRNLANSLEESQEPGAIPVQNTRVRPSKRLRLAKAAAYVSCAALGGAAAFSVLVSTAPF